MISRFLRKQMTADGLGLLIVILAVSIFTSGISSSLRNTDSNDFFWFCFAAMWIGFGLGKIRLKGWFAVVGLTVLGIQLVWILRANLSTPLLTLLESVFLSLPQFINAIRNGEPVNASAIIEAWTVIAQISSAIWVRLRTWLFNVNHGVVINDALILSMIWTLLMWLCSAWMGWFAEKRNAFTSFLPSLALMAAITSYNGRRIDALWVMVLLLLFLMGIWNYRRHTLEWREKSVDHSDSISLDISRAVLFLTMAIGTLAIITPSISWREIAEDIRDRQTGSETAELLGVQEPLGSGDSSNRPSPSLPRDHLLSGGFATSERIVMLVRTGEFAPASNPSLEILAPRHYWRSTIYDEYLGTGWVSSAVSAQNVPPNSPLIPGILIGYRPLHLEVLLENAEGGLFWSGVLFSANIPISANWRVRPPSDLFADQAALLQADLFAAATDAEAYHAEAFVPISSLQELRSAPAEYPEKIRERYLSLPSSVPNRVRDLSQKITNGITNPYERAKAIETYLRTNYPYDLDIPPPQHGQDVADYFLFDLKRGYCDYYATAMVVLARANGLPARFVSGYSTGMYDAQNAQYIIREKNAHSWVEIFFPGIGWIEFEPTASLPEIERAKDSADRNSDQDSEQSALQALARFRMEQLLLWFSPLLVLLSSSILYFLFVERWLFLRLGPEALIDRVYQRFYRAARPLAGAWTPAETSSEFLDKLISSRHGSYRRTYLKKLKGRIDTNAVRLTNLYHATLFVNRNTTKEDAATAWRLWKLLQRDLFVMRWSLKIAKTNHVQN